MHDQALENNDLVKRMAKESEGYAPFTMITTLNRNSHIGSVNESWDMVDWDELLEHVIAAPARSSSYREYDRMLDEAIEEANDADREAYIIDFECDFCVTYCECELDNGFECEACEIVECECDIETWETKVDYAAVAAELHADMIEAARVVAIDAPVWRFVHELNTFAKVS